jgi:predicted phosphodiesterase
VRVAVLSDIHANLVALDAVLGSLGSVDAVWHLGDIVGYGPDPDGVVARLIEVGAVGVRGNHDAAAAGGDEIDWFNPDARAAMEWTRGRISETTRDWLAGLPERHAVDGFGFVHGSPREPLWEYIVSVPIARANLALLTTPIGLFGHTHLPMVFAERDGVVEQIEPGNGSTFALAGRQRLECDRLDAQAPQLSEIRHHLPSRGPGGHDLIDTAEHFTGQHFWVHGDHQNICQFGRQ